MTLATVLIRWVERVKSIITCGAGTGVGKQLCFNYGALLSLSLSAATGGFEACPSGRSCTCRERSPIPY